MLREDLEQLLVEGEVDLSRLNDSERTVITELESRGALFPGEIAERTSRPPAEIESALLSLLVRGLVTADGYDNVRLFAHKKESNPARPGRRSLLRRLPRRRSCAGRWWLLRGAAAAHATPESTARQLLERYGVVFRDLMARETPVFGWRQILVELRRMEARGEIRGGRFVNGFVGEQFAHPEAVDTLRTVRRTRNKAADPVTLSASDPLNLAGIVTPGPKTRAQGDARVVV